MKSLIILGRQPALGVAELESIFGPKSLKIISHQAITLDIAPENLDFSRLGGSIKLAEILTELNTVNWSEVESYLTENILSYLKSVTKSKVNLGISAYNLRVSAKEVNTTGLRLKKIIRSSNRSARIIPNKSASLNSAQVLHNKLIGSSGLEIVVAKHGNKIIIAKTMAEQDIESYAARDQKRPKRDARVGMLPPKLAQIIVNLANPTIYSTVLDPFCGTGVVLQEAWLMGYSVYGTDINQRMIEYSKANISDWLSSRYNRNGDIIIEQGDATRHRWDESREYAVAGETFLGKPLSTLPPKQVLDKIINECDLIHKKFLINIGSQLKPGSRLCLAVPAWKTRNGFLHLKTLDLLEELGYTRKSFVHTSNAELIYHRPEQIVARELVILERNDAK